MIISISGTPGSGKSTVAKMLVEKLGLVRLYAGGALRELALKKGITIEAILEQAKTNTSIDIELDEMISSKAKEIEKSGENVVAEGRTQFHFIPDSIKIFVKVDITEGASRIFKDLQDTKTTKERNEDAVKSLQETIDKVQKREQEDRQRYIDLYKIDYLNEKNYDFVIDTTNISAQEATNKVIEFVKSKQ